MRETQRTGLKRPISHAASNARGSPKEAILKSEALKDNKSCRDGVEYKAQSKRTRVSFTGVCFL